VRGSEARIAHRLSAGLVAREADHPTLVRQIASMGGGASPFAPPNVIKALKAKFKKAE
jgi:hypothetical protein